MTSNHVTSEGETVRESAILLYAVGMVALPTIGMIQAGVRPQLFLAVLTVVGLVTVLSVLGFSVAYHTAAEFKRNRSDGDST